MVYKKSMIVEVFWEYLSKFFIFLHQIYFDSKILIYCKNIKSLIMGDLVTLKTRLKVLIFAVFYYFEYFSIYLLWQKPVA